jgi:hypothetical protein
MDRIAKPMTDPPSEQLAPEEMHIVLSDRMILCTVGSIHALNLRRTCSEVIGLSGDTNSHGRIRSAMNDALDDLLAHRFKCKKCREG